VVHDAELAGDKINDAAIDLGVAQAPNPFPSAESLGEPAQTFIEVQIAGGIDEVSSHLQSGVTAALKETATGLGLTPTEAMISAGICSNLVLAPITGPLESAATFVEIATAVIAFAAGMHPLALACIKLLAHDEAPHLLSQGVVRLIDGSASDVPKSDVHAMMMQRAYQMIEQQRASSDLVSRPETYGAAPHRARAQGQAPERADAAEARENTRRGAVWLCLVFVPRQPEASDEPRAGTGRVSDRGNDVAKTVVLPPGDDEFFGALPEILHRSTGSEVDGVTAKELNLPAGWYFVVHAEGVGASRSSGTSNTQVAYLHPGCQTGHCVPWYFPRCSCECSVCLSLCRDPVDG